MIYPADQESTVFYNPVQVQNRDLSILIISLFGERRACQLSVKRFQQSLKQEQGDKSEESDPKKFDDSIKNNTGWKEKLTQFEAALDPTKAVQDLYQQDSSNGLCILDALAASGLRSIRYWKEIPGVHHVTINDLDAAAVDRAKTNITANQLESALIDDNNDQQRQCRRRSKGIFIQTGDATDEMYRSRPTNKLRPGFVAEDGSWDVIDLDPYGSAAPFLDAAIQAVANGGLLACTCTDMAALGGSRPEICFGRYGAMPIQRASYLQEMALRILLQSMAVTAAKYGRTIRPLLSVGMDFYVRVFVTVHDDKTGVNHLSLQMGYVYQSTQCMSFEIINMGHLGGKKQNVYQAGRAPAVCAETGASFKIGGPIWTGPLHDPNILQAALDCLSGRNKGNASINIDHLATKDRLRGLLMSCRDELHDIPLFYRLPDVAKNVHTSTPPMEKVRNALINAGYRVSAYHKDPQAIKTNAPAQVIWDIMRTWYQHQKEVNAKSTKPPKEGSVGEKILSRQILTNIDFTKPKASNGTVSGEDKVARFPLNPPNWGPKKAATGYKRKAEDQESTITAKEMKDAVE